MPGPFESVLYVQDRMGEAHEVINQARSAAYLAHPSLALDGMSICDILDFGGCENYLMEPTCVPDAGGWFDFPGSTTNSVTVPDAANLDITGDLGLVFEIAPDDSTPTIARAFVSKWGNAAGELSFVAWLGTDGSLLYTWIEAAGAQRISVSTVVPGLVSGGFRWIAIMHDVNNGAGGTTIHYHTSDDGLNFTEFDTDNAGGIGPTNIRSSTGLFRISGYDTNGVSAPWQGNVREMSYRNGIGVGGTVGGTEVLRLTRTDFEGINPTATSMTISTGQTATIGHTGSPQTFVVPFVASHEEWVPLIFNTPATDPAPWYNANYPQSADALGFYITAWTGLDDGHLKRGSQPIGGYGGGSRLSPIASDGRIMKLNLFIFGRSEEATEYLFRWLAATLSGVCASCATNSILIRRYCGNTEEPSDGLAQLRNVGLVEGLKWEADLVERGSCYMRQASFALEAGDPCMYLPDTDRPVSVMDADADVDACLNGLTLNADREFCRPGCSELTANCRTIRTFEVDPLGAMAPVITWDNTLNSYTYPFRAIVYADPGETGAVPNPCGLRVLGELYVRALPPSSSMRWDITGRTIEYRDHTTGGWVGGWAYTQASDPPNRRFFALPCGTSQLVMEPSSMCAEEVDADTFTLDGTTYDPPRFPTVSITLQERIGCP